MKQNEYIPQFDYDNIEETQLPIKTCKGCGRTGQYLGLDENGLCFECRNKNQTEQSSGTQLPNEELFKQYVNHRTEKRTRIFMPGFLWMPLWKYGLGGFLIAGGILWIINALIQFNMHSIGTFILTSILSSLLIGIGFLFIKRSKKLACQKFQHYNDMEVTVVDNEWICPYCGNSMIGIQHCDQCGVLPVLKQLK